MIGSKLREIREATGMNKKEFAQYLGLKYTTYNNYETEAREPASDFLILISEKFDVSIDYLLGLKDESEILHSYQLKAGEYEHIKKYRSLDPYGQETVNYILDREAARTAALNEKDVLHPLEPEKSSLKVCRLTASRYPMFRNTKEYHMLSVSMDIVWNRSIMMAICS